MNIAPPEPAARLTVVTGYLLRDWRGFLLINVAVLLVFFWPVIFGDALLSPLDIPANLFAKYRYLDPSATGVPANHYIIDMIFGDLSRNVLVHEAWNRGEIPWWDPYTDCGKPLGAEAHVVNISDPLRYGLFCLLPFEPAYNWSRILPFLLSGVTMFLLLTRLEFSFGASLWAALLYEFAGCQILMFSGPTFQASFSYVPLLWLLWHQGATRRRVFWFVLSSAVLTLILLSGNIQTHAYMVLFSAALIFGYGFRERGRWPVLSAGVAISWALGLGLSAPFVLPELEMFFLSVRSAPEPETRLGWLSGIASVSAVFPWTMGTFRTLDASKVFGHVGLGFWIYIGSAAIVMSIIGFSHGANTGSKLPVKRTAVALMVLYFLVCSTPLIRLLYTRFSFVAVLGVVVLFAFGWEHIVRLKERWRRFAAGVIGGTVLMLLVLNIAGWVIYPSFGHRLEERVRSAQRHNPRLDAADDLRRFQVRNLRNEITLRNPETVFAAASLIALACVCWRLPKSRTLALHGVLLLSTFPLLWFGHRYIPMHSRKLFAAIRAGGPEQQKVLGTIRPSGMRLREVNPGWHESLFPGAMAQLYKCHVMHGHTSLPVPNAAMLTNAASGLNSPLFDYEYVSRERGKAAGELHVTSSHSRFQWHEPSPREVRIVSETLNTLTVSISSGPSGDLIRTDTYYPGWRAFSDGREVPLVPFAPVFARLTIPADVTEITFRYEPRFWRTGLLIAGVATLALAALLGATWKRKTTAA